MYVSGSSSALPLKGGNGSLPGLSYRWLRSRRIIEKEIMGKVRLVLLGSWDKCDQPVGFVILQHHSKRSF